jgi:hypothetical protein
MKRNFFETTLYLVENYFVKDVRRASKAESTVRNAIEYVKN